jgi:Carbohydrate family 9 binding domain-like
MSSSISQAPKEKVIRLGHVERAATASIFERSEIRDWNKGAPELMKRLAAYGAVYNLEPATQFCLQSARRQLGDVGASNDVMTRLRRVLPGGPWHEAANAELWLTQRDQAVPRRLARARYTEVRPFLDGKLDDACWQGVKPMVLENAVGDSTRDHVTEAMFAFDQEFLYVALRCTHPAGKHAAQMKPRPKDADLAPFDRVSLLFDLDRDYTTFYHLEVDQRGCVRDRCWGDKSWNPRWFVAIDSNETSWQVEAAIPLGELTGERITQNTAWAFNIVRTVPGRGVQAWSLPADVEPRPEGMSLLLFPTGNARPMAQVP